MKKRWILASVAAVAVIGSYALLNGHDNPHAQAAAGGPPPVTVAQVLVRNVDDSGEFTGRLQAIDTIELRPRVSGYVDSIHFTEGAAVKKGQLLFQIDPRPYQAEVDRLNANLAQARAEQALAQANADRVPERQNASSFPPSASRHAFCISSISAGPMPRMIGTKR